MVRHASQWPWRGDGDPVSVAIWRGQPLASRRRRRTLGLAGRSGPVALCLSPGGDLTLGSDMGRGEVLHAVVPAGAWQAARPLGTWCLCCCVVAPAFRFAGSELAPPGWHPAGAGNRRAGDATLARASARLDHVTRPGLITPPGRMPMAWPGVRAARTRPAAS